jgi:DNA replication protein DnaC
MGCERCGGTGFLIVTRDDGREFAQPCACRRQGATAVGADALVQAARIPPRYEHCLLTNFDSISGSHRAALERAMSYCSGYPHLGSEEGLGLLFTGSSGVGKTHLAVAVLQELASAKRVKSQFWDFQELMREIRNSYNPETSTTELQVLEPVINTDLLVLDDLGAWKVTDWMNDTLFYLLNSRYLARRATLITTNFIDVSPEQAKRSADQHITKEFLVERIGVRLRSRLMEMCLLVPIDGSDFRQTRQHGNRVAVLGTEGAGQEPAAPPLPQPRPRFGG